MQILSRIHRRKYVDFGFFLDYLPIGIDSKEEVRYLGGFPLLHYFHNCKIEVSGLIHLFWTLCPILSGLLLVLTYMKLEHIRLKYDIILV